MSRRQLLQHLCSQSSINYHHQIHHEKLHPSVKRFCKQTSFSAPAHSNILFREIRTSCMQDSFLKSSQKRKPRTHGTIWFQFPNTHTTVQILKRGGCTRAKSDASKLNAEHVGGLRTHHCWKFLQLASQLCLPMNFQQTMLCTVYISQLLLDTFFEKENFIDFKHNTSR